MSGGALAMGQVSPADWRTAVRMCILIVYTDNRGTVRTRISKWGNSLAIRIPKAFVADAELEDGDDVDVSLVDGRVIITPVRPDYALEDLVDGITAENRHSETDWGEPQGAEVW